MTIYKKIANVSGLLVGKLKADKTNQQQRYDYLSADLILQEAGMAMAEHGVVLIPSIVAESVETIEYTDSYGKQKTRLDAVIEFEMTVTDGESEIKSKWFGRGSDYATPDKALYKAITSGHKYFIMKLFNIGIGNTDSEHEEPQSAPKKPPQQPTQQQAPQQKSGVSDDQRKPSDKMLKKLFAVGINKYGDNWNDKRKELVTAVTKGRTDSSKQITFDECSRLIDGIEGK